jgi:hypothetical protein
MYFQKLLSNIADGIDIKSSIEGVEPTRDYSAHSSVGLSYYSLNKEVFNELLNRFPENIRPDFVNVGIMTTPHCPSHKDHMNVHLLERYGFDTNSHQAISTNLLYYVSAGDGVTNFYEPKPGAKELHPQNSGKNSRNITYLNHDLDKVAHFVAEAGDYYLLNVSKVHSVNNLVNPPRMMLTFSWHLKPYQEVLDQLIINNVCTLNTST